MKIDSSLCDICGTCAGVCPVDAIRIFEFKVEIDNEKCIDCKNCLIICPAEAIKEEK